MSDSPFQAGGPLLASSPVYIPREADEKAAAHLRRMEYITLVEPREHGKTSLINQLIGQFSSSQRYTFAVRDLMPAKSSASSPTDWYASLGKWLVRQLRFIPRDQRPDPPTDSASWEDFLADVAESGEAVGQRVVIVLDEIGAMPPEWATTFFSVIRSVYTSRQSLPFWQHLTFIIAGAFNPKELIQDETVSNFNVDQRIPLNDFNLPQVKQLVAHLDLPGDLTEAVAERVYYWTDGQPYLSQRLCLYLAERKELITGSKIDDMIDDAVERFFRDDTHHLLRIKRLITEPDLLAYTRHITSEPRSRFSAGLNDKHFRLAHIIGVLKASPNGLCQIRNRIYERALAEIEVLSEPELAMASQLQDELRYDAFISYSHKNSAWVRDTLRSRLEGEGLRVCIDYRDFEPGAPSLTEMERAILQSRKTLLVLTPDYLDSEWAEFENILASTLDPAARRRRVIPLLLKPCELPLRIRALTYLDFTKSDEIEFQFQRLVVAIRTEPKSDQPPPTLQPISPKASDLRLLVADASGKQLVSHREFSIPPRDPSRRPAYEVAFRLYLDNPGQTIARYVIIDMFVTSDTDFFLAYPYESEPFLVEESPRPWQITPSKTYDRCYFEGGIDFVCHSKVQQHLGLVKMLVPYGQPDTTVTFRYRILAEGYESRGSFAIALKLESKE